MMTSRKRQRLVRTATACCIGVAAATATNESSLDRLASSVSSWWRPLHDESAASLLVAVEPRRDKIRLDRELENEDEEEDNNKDDEEEDDKQDENEQQEDDEGDDQDDNKNDGDAKNDDGANQGEDDDFFDDAIQDDQYSDDIVFAIDDFYAYQEDPRPPTLFPLTARTVIGYFIASLALTLGCSGGSGGGGILIPVYILVMGLPLKIAVPSGAVTVLGGAMGSTMLNWSRRHPLADRPLIDWDLVLVMVRSLWRLFGCCLRPFLTCPLHALSGATGTCWYLPGHLISSGLVREVSRRLVGAVTEYYGAHDAHQGHAHVPCREALHPASQGGTSRTSQR